RRYSPGRLVHPSHRARSDTDGKDSRQKNDNCAEQHSTAAFENPRIMRVRMTECPPRLCRKKTDHTREEAPHLNGSFAQPLPNGLRFSGERKRVRWKRVLGSCVSESHGHHSELTIRAAGRPVTL